MSHATWLTTRAPHRHPGRRQARPEGSRDRCSSDQCGVPRGHVGTSVRAGGQGGSRPPAARSLDPSLNEATPEQLLGRADHQGQPGGQLGQRADLSERVGLVDVLTTPGHHPARCSVADPEDRVQGRGRSHSEDNVSETDADVTKVRVASDGQRSERQSGDGHALPEAFLRTPECERERAVRSGERCPEHSIPPR